MGYAGSALDNDYGAVLTTVQFLNVGAENTIKLKNIVPVAAEGVDLDGCIQMQSLNTDGSTDFDNCYDWESGIWKCNGVDASETDLFVGKGLFVASYAGEDVVLRSSGQVNEKAITIALDNDYGAIATGNSFPMGVPLKNFIPTAEEGIDLDGCIQMQSLNTDGTTDFANCYDWEGGIWKCNGVDASETIIPAGKGLFVASYAGENADLVIVPPEF